MKPFASKVTVKEEPYNGHLPVKIRNLGVTFKAKKEQVTALANLDLDFGEGQVTALLGQNGAGKTTTISILTGMLLPSEGDATVYGHSVVSSKGVEEVRAISGVCPQHDIIFTSLTVKENLKLVGAIKGVDAESLIAEAGGWMDKVGLPEDRRGMMTGRLSGGQKRKLSLACALIGDPKFILLDEPTAGMDPASRRTVWDVLSSVKVGKTLVLTTHFLDEADALGDRVAMLHKGRLRCVGSPAFLKANYGKACHLNVVHKNSNGSPPILSLISGHVNGACVEKEQGVEVQIALPQLSSHSFAPLFAAIDKAAPSLSIDSYGLSLPTLQEAFLKVIEAADQAAIDEEEAATLQKTSSSRRLEKGGLSARSGNGGDGGESGVGVEMAVLPMTNATEVAPPEERLVQKRASRFQQARAMRSLFLTTFNKPAMRVIICILLTIELLAFAVVPAVDPYTLVAPPQPLTTDVNQLSTLDLTYTGLDSTAIPISLPQSGVIESGLDALASTSGYTVDSRTGNLSDTLLDGSEVAVTAIQAPYTIVNPWPGVPPTTGVAVYYNASYESSLPAGVHLLDNALFNQVLNRPLNTKAALLPMVGEQLPRIKSPPLLLLFGSIVVLVIMMM